MLDLAPPIFLIGVSLALWCLAMSWRTYGHTAPRWWVRQQPLYTPGWLQQDGREHFALVGLPFIAGVVAVAGFAWLAAVCLPAIDKAGHTVALIGIAVLALSSLATGYFGPGTTLLRRWVYPRWLRPARDYDRELMRQRRVGRH